MKDINLILVSRDKDYFKEFCSALRGNDSLKTSCISSGLEALEAVSGSDVHIVAAAEEVAEGSGLDLVRQIVMKNPFVNTTLASPLSHDEFHEVTEGLGILMQLPPHPGKEDADRFCEFLSRIY